MLLAGLLAAVAASVPARADVVTARIAAPTPIAAHGDRLAWSEFDPAAGRFRLVSRVGGTTAPVPVPPRRLPFDVDLGPDERGHVVAVYSRCAREPSVQSIRFYERARGCDLHEYDFVERRETRIAGANSPTASEYWPTVWKDRVAFARVYDSRPRHPYLYVRPLVGGGRSQRLPGGQRNECRTDRRSGRRSCSPADRSGPVHLELYGRRLAFGWRYQGFGETLDWDLRLVTIGGGRRRLDRDGGGGLTAMELGWPAFEAGRLYWARNCYGDPSGCAGRYRLVRHRLATGLTERALPPAEQVLSHDRGGGLTWLLRDDARVGDCQGDPPRPGGTCELAGVEPGY